MKRTLVTVGVVIALAACSDIRQPTAPTAAGPAALAASTSGSAGATSERIPVPRGVLFNPCTGEGIVYSGTIHIVTKTSVGPDGQSTRVSTNYQDMHGVSPTGRRYVLAENDKEAEVTYLNGASDFRTSVNFRVISQGSLDNWFVRIAYRISTNAAGERVVTTERSDSECRG